MTLSEVVRASVADCCDADLSRETRFGKANQVDFSGRSALIGNIRVELERRREDPVNNVVKAWRQAAENPSEPAFILVHIFSGFYLSRRAKFENARFIGEMMNMWADTSGRSITYVAVLLDFEPPMGDADPIIGDAVAQTIREQIRRQLDGRIQKRTITKACDESA
ncbi:MAG TPA: hypothetical protein VNL14_22110 [Candidatus Acidoferrales bacterium]|nr:hypothetical protein [Candidatus Acidoferrales bacterium]